MRKTILSLVGASISVLVIAQTPFASAQTLPSETTVLVLPFSAPSDGSAWIGKAVQQDLLADLTQASNARVLAPADLAPALDSQAALKAGHDAGASLVIFGQSQSTTKEIRLTGQVLDVSSGKPLSGLKATGPSDDLFHLEDALAGQVVAAVPHALLKPQVNQENQPLGALAAPQGQQYPSPTSVYVAPTSNGVTDYSPQPGDFAPTYSYNYYQVPDYGSYAPTYTYPYSDLGLWPYWGTGVVFLGNGFRGHFHYRDGFHDGGHAFRSGGTGLSFNSAHFSPVRSGFSSGGIARQSFAGRAAPRVSSGGFHAGGFHAAAGGGFHGFSGGAARGGGGHR